MPVVLNNRNDRTTVGNVLLLLAGFERFAASTCTFYNGALDVLSDLLSGASRVSCSFKEEVIMAQSRSAQPASF